MVRTLGNIVKLFFISAILFGFSTSSGLAQQDPPSRVARLNHLEGSVSMEPAGADDWVPAEINRPFTTGDYLYTDQGARAELHLDEAVLRMGSQTSFGFLNLNDQAVQIKLSEGDMYFRLRDLAPNQTFEVDTPNAAISLVANGTYRFRVDPNGNMSYVVVRQGQAQITGGGQAIEVDAGNSAMLSGTDQLSYDVEAAPQPDDFDNWSGERDAREARLASRRYVPQTVIGYEDLDDYGSWQQASEYGPVWYPNQIPSGWAPYQYGHWAWVDPWGWTWVDDAPWGFAPFHYGRWANIGGRWGWCPGPIAATYGRPVVRPYYAPALVAWFGGSHFGVSFSVGGGPSLGWVPLGFGEAYTPPYVVSQRYFQNVNVSNTRITETNITNVYNTVYVNHTVYNQQFVNTRAPGAVVAMPQTAFASGRPVRQVAVPIRQLDPASLRAAAVVTPAVAPTRQALAPTIGRPAPRPAAQVVQRPVVARSTPPTPPATFAARQQYLQQHAGQLLNYEAMHQAVAAVTKPPAPAVKTVAPERPVPVHAGARVGNVQAAAEPNQPRPGEFPANQPRQAPVPANQQRAGQPAANQPVTTPTPAGQPVRPGSFPQEQQRPAAQVGQPGAPTPHGTPPNMRPGPKAQPTENPRTIERTPQGQPVATNPRVPERPQPQPEPAARTQQQPSMPAAHGTPPNMRPGNTAAPAENPRAVERTPQGQPAATNPRGPERSQPQAEPPPHTQQQPNPPAAHGTPPNMPPRNTAQPNENSHVTERTPQEQPQTRVEARPQPQPTARPMPEPPARTEARPAPAQEHRAPPKDNKDTHEQR
jgi:FecR protein